MDTIYSRNWPIRIDVLYLIWLCHVCKTVNYVSEYVGVVQNRKKRIKVASNWPPSCCLVSYYKFRRVLLQIYTLWWIYVLTFFIFHFHADFTQKKYVKSEKSAIVRLINSELHNCTTRHWKLCIYIYIYIYLPVGIMIKWARSHKGILDWYYDKMGSIT